MGPRRYMLVPLVGAVTAFVDWVFARLAESGVSYIFGWPAWVTGIIAALLLVAWWLLETVVRLREQLAPKLSLSFNPDDGGIIKTPEKEKDKKTGFVIKKWETVYVRASVETSTEIAVENCTPFLVSVAKKSDGFRKTQFIDPIQLPWSLTTTGAIQMYKGVRRHVDVLKANSIQNKLELPDQCIWPLTLGDFFENETTYRVQIIVVGGGLSESIEIDVHWSGDWDKLTAEKK